MKWLMLSVLCFFVLSSRAQLLDYESALDTVPVFTSLEEALKDPLSVYRLDLSHQKRKEFPPEIFQLSNLNELKLDRNKIMVIPPDISKLKYLQRFSIQHNLVDTMPVALCSLTALRRLNLSDNFITVIPEEIEQLRQLEILLLWQNPIEVYPPSLGMLENLVELDLLHNLMTAEEQNTLRNILPNTFIHFSPPCNCGAGE